MRRLLLTILALLAFAMPLLAPGSPVYAQNKDDVCQGVGQVTGGSNCAPTGSVTDVNGVVRTALRIFQVIVGIIALVFVVLAGQRFITSAGEAQKVVSARNTLLYAAVGIVVVAFSELIIQFVLNRTIES